MNYSDAQISAIKDLIFRMADDQLILGHRNSEWTGLGPILEEDIAFSSMAQDKLGHSQALYQILHRMGEADPDSLAFGRKENKMRCCHFVEYPIGDYSFSLMRHFLFDESEALRFDMLGNSSFEDLSNTARKFRGELKYHTMHAEIWIKQLSNGNDESRIRMQNALNICYPLALGLFEPCESDDMLIESGVFPGEKALQEKWSGKVNLILSKTDLKIPEVNEIKTGYGGRKGIHTEFLKPLLDEMTEVYNIDPHAEW